MLFKFPPKLGSMKALQKYLEADLFSWMRDLSVGLLKLNFTENFDSFQIDNLLIPVNMEVAIPNQLKNKSNNMIPSSRMIVRQQGYGIVTDGQTPWNQNILYLFNNGPQATTINVIFFK